MIALLISIVAIISIFLLYYKSPTRLLLRALSIVLLYVLISNITLSMKLKRTQNEPAILIDYSASMKRYLSDVLQKIGRLNFPHAKYFFGEDLLTETPEDTSKLGKFTDITNALSMVSELNPSAIILISDGNHNYGDSPLDLADDLNVPVYSFGVGGVLTKDIAILDVSYPEYIFRGDSIKIEVVVESRGFATGDGEIELRLSSDEKVQIKSFPLADVPARNTIEFSWLAGESGEEKFSIHIKPKPSEESTENNSFESSLNIIEERIKVLYYSDHLSFNTKFILRALSTDNQLEIFPIVRMTQEYFLKLDENEKIQTLPNPDEFAVLILDNINLQRLPWSNIMTWLNKGRVLLVGSVEGINNPWRDFLPINMAPGSVRGNYSIKIVQPFSRLSPGDNYPPLSIINRSFGAKEDAVIIAQANNLPIIAYRRRLQGIIFQINILDIGTWQFLQSGITQKDLLYFLFGDIIRFLSPLGQNRLVLKSLKKDYTIGETIRLTLQSYDRDYKPSGGGDFYLEFGDAKIPFFEIKHALYEATFVAREIGAFELVARGTLGDEPLHSDELTINVLTRPAEVEQSINKELLQRLSLETKGKYFDLESIENFQLPKSEDSYVSRSISLDSPLIYVLILSLLVADWILRRRQGVV